MKVGRAEPGGKLPVPSVNFLDSVQGVPGGAGLHLHARIAVWQAGSQTPAEALYTRVNPECFPSGSAKSCAAARLPYNERIWQGRR